MLSIRFARTGKKSNAYFRIIAVDKQKDPWGKFLEILGNYNPRTKEANLKVERIKYWLSKGAEPSASLHNLFITKGIIEGKKVRVTSLSKKRKEKIAAKQPKEPAPAATAHVAPAEPSEPAQTA